jgi:hypothetical protein
MRNRKASYEADVINNQNFRTHLILGKTSIDLIENNPVSEILAAEGREDFVNYIKGLGLANDPNQVLLSSLHHYYYDDEEMKNVKTVINLKELNHIKQLKSFLHSIIQIIPQKSNFIGCFIDNRNVNGYELRNNSSTTNNKTGTVDLENGIVSQIPIVNRFYSFIDSKTNKFMSKSSVTLMLEEHGFKVLDMKEINSLTYFHSQKCGNADN